MKRTKATTPSAEENQIKNLVIQAFKSTGYLIINKSLMQDIGLVRAVLLSYLIDKYKYWKGVDFYCTHDNISQDLGISGHQIREAKKYLLGHEYISTYKSGTPAKEFYIINFTILYRGLVVQKLDDLPSNNYTTIYNKTKYNKNKYKGELSETPSSDKITLKERNELFLPLAKQLAAIIQTKKNIKITTSQLKTWANEIRKLTENSEVEFDRIKKALRWYSKNIGGQYIPVIESGASLRNKFIQLENAIQSNGYTNKPKSPKSSNRVLRKKPNYETDRREE